MNVMTIAPKKSLELLAQGALPQDRPSQRMLKTWAKRIKHGRAATVPVFVGGKWSLQILRGHKRVLQLGLTEKAAA